MRKAEYQLFATLVFFFLVAVLTGIYLTFASGVDRQDDKNTQMTECVVAEHTVMGTVYCFVKCSSLKHNYNATTVKPSVNATSKNATNKTG